MRKKMFGVIGHPIKHSLSPLMHNTVFKSLGLDYEYVALDVKAGELAGKMVELKEKGFLGINVTIPHKVSVIQYVDVLSEDAELAGAVNTVKFGKKTIGYNTDGLGCVNALNDAEVGLKGKKVLVLGAGGASRAICFQLARQNADVWVTDVIKEKAFELASDIKQKIGGRAHATILGEELRIVMKGIDVLVNATPIGMHPNVDETPINPGMIKKETTVMDIVYNPVETRLLREAKKKGCKTVNGVGMFVHQGAAALRIWLDIEPPVELMRKTVAEALK